MPLVLRSFYIPISDRVLYVEPLNKLYLMTGWMSIMREKASKRICMIAVVLGGTVVLYIFI